MRNMKTQISLEQIKQFREIYNSNKTNKIIENAITKNGLESACIDRNIIIENQPVFNIELPESKRYDQQNSWRCWIYGGLNLIKHNIAKNLNINVIDLELSNNHIAFFDKLEKSNNAYENIINIKDTSFEYLHKENIIKYCVSEGGYWEWFVAIVNKYGILPYSYSPNAVESTNAEKIEYLYTEKVKKDIIKLLKLKENGTDANTLREEKNRFLQENYILLCKILGEPTTEFNYEYKDKNGEYKRFENYIIMSLH
ncbi:MAG: C1 family peptidase [Clostridia bacterium]